jgi:hypothetical protein
MLSAIIGTFNNERFLVHTLASLVAGAIDGSLREVIVADGGSTDETEKIADIAGCEFLRAEAPLAQRLRAGAATARSPWLMFLVPGVMLDPTWTDETSHFLRNVQAAGDVDARAAVFSKARQPGGQSSTISEAISLFRAALGGRATPEQGLIIARTHYERIGGHRDQAADAQADLIKRIGRKKISLLRSGAAMTSIT